MKVQDLLQAAVEEHQRDVDEFQLEREARAASGGDVRLFTSAFSVLTALMGDPRATIRELAARCGRTERAVWQQLRDLEGAGLLTRQRQGRRNVYQVDTEALDRQLRLEGAAVLSSSR